MQKNSQKLTYNQLLYSWEFYKSADLFVSKAFSASQTLLTACCSLFFTYCLLLSVLYGEMEVGF
jgi:hypothetical protein